MKILAINGSPHEGNTSDKINQIKHFFSSYDDVDFEIINLKDMNILPCKGCFVCFMKGRNMCPFKDDREVIEQKMMNADGVIFATPVYSMHVSNPHAFKTRERYLFVSFRPILPATDSVTAYFLKNLGRWKT
jgi:multimeric flavodoxin WrbA